MLFKGLLDYINPKFNIVSLIQSGLSCGSAGKRICLQCGRPGFDTWVGKIPWRRNGNPLQYSGLENSMNCIVHGVTKSRTQLSDFHVYFIQSRLTMHILSWTICVQEVLDLLRLSVSQLSGISPLTKEWVSEMSYTGCRYVSLNRVTRP